MIHIPIAIATDNNYIPLIVTLVSLNENARKDTFYDIYVLIDDLFKPCSKQIVNACLKRYESSCSLYFTNVGSVFEEAPARIAHITRPTFFRLVVPELLNEDKCIYLDTDTIVLSDLQSLFMTTLKNCYIAGVRHPEIILCEGENKVCMEAGIPSNEQYINAGVLVMNLKELRSNGMVRNFLKLIPKNFITQDQDIINYACYGKIHFLSFKYNVMTKLAGMNIQDYKNCFQKEDIKEAWNRPCIIHYADQNKPWNSSECVFMDYWWKYFRRSLLYKNIVNDFMNDLIINIIYHSQTGKKFTKKIPKIFDITFDRKYVIYGAGKRASEFISFILNIGIIPEYIVVSDKNNNPSEIQNIEIREISEVCNNLHNRTIIIAVRENLHKEIISSLQQFDYGELLPVSDQFMLFDI